MFALIHTIPAQLNVSMLPIAGQTLLARQLQWLRRQGVEHVAVELPRGEAGDALARWLAHDSLGAGVLRIHLNQPLTLRDLVRRAGFSSVSPLVVLPGNALIEADLAALIVSVEGDAVIQFSSPPSLSVRGLAALRLRRGEGRPASVLAPQGWGVQVSTERSAMEVGSAALSGALPGVLLHGAQLAPGQWAARGARVEQGARLVGSVYLGPGSLVREGAVVGPNVELGSGAIVERDAVLSDVFVSDGVIVGQGMTVQNGVLTGRVVRRFDTRQGAAIADSLLLSAVHETPPMTDRLRNWIARREVRGIEQELAGLLEPDEKVRLDRLSEAL